MAGPSSAKKHWMGSKVPPAWAFPPFPVRQIHSQCPFAGSKKKNPGVFSKTGGRFFFFFFPPPLGVLWGGRRPRPPGLSPPCNSLAFPGGWAPYRDSAAVGAAPAPPPSGEAVVFTANGFLEIEPAPTDPPSKTANGRHKNFVFAPFFFTTSKWRLF